MRNLMDLFLAQFPISVVSVALPTQNMGNAVSEMQGKRSYTEKQPLSRNICTAYYRQNNCSQFI